MSAANNSEPAEPRQKILKTSKAAKISAEYTTENFKKNLAFSYASKSNQGPTQEDVRGFAVYTVPFKHVTLPRLLEDGDFVDGLISELQDLEMLDKNNDLYKFKQSIELKHGSSPCIKAFRTMMKDQMLPTLREGTGIPLNDKIDLFCSCYEYTDTLLCHDDELEGRRLAYMYYLVPKNWIKEDGGMLDLFDTDEKGQPGKVVKSIIPQQNDFVFFEVTPSSFHQVSEVLAESKTRLALSGWFHGPPVVRPMPHIEPPDPITPCGGVEEMVFFDWINPVYISQEIQNDIRERFEAESELELSDFLKDEKYEELLAALHSASLVWTHRGPANKRSYDICLPDNLPGAVRTFIQILRSDAMFLLLSSMTGLSLHENPAADGQTVPNGSAAIKGAGTVAKCRVEVQRFRHGDYTLLHDTDPHVGEMALDLVMFVGGKDWAMESGGYISYVAKEEDEELLSVCPSPNSLALVYKDIETIRFTKHINNRVTETVETQYCTVAATYYENAD